MQEKKETEQPYRRSNFKWTWPRLKRIAYGIDQIERKSITYPDAETGKTIVSTWHQLEHPDEEQPLCWNIEEREIEE